MNVIADYLSIKHCIKIYNLVQKFAIFVILSTLVKMTLSIFFLSFVAKKREKENRNQKKERNTQLFSMPSSLRLFGHFL